MFNASYIVSDVLNKAWHVFVPKCKKIWSLLHNCVNCLFHIQKAIYFRGYCLKAIMKTSPHVSSATWLASSWVEKGADRMHMNSRSVTSSLWMKCDPTLLLMDTNGWRHEMSKYWQKKKIKETIYYLAELPSKVFSQCMWKSSLIFSEEHPCHLLLSSLQNLLFCSTFLDFFITNCNPTSGFVNWTAVIHRMKLKCKQHAKENHTKIKLNYTWHLIFQKKDFVCRNFDGGLLFFSFFTFKSAKIDVWKKTAKSRPLEIT